MYHLFLRADLLKSADRGGKYHTKIQDGWESDGTPKYKYFYSQDEYEKYKDKQGHGMHQVESDLEQEVEKEHTEGKRFVEDHQPRVPKADTPKADHDSDNKKRQHMLYLNTD